MYSDGAMLRIVAPYLLAGTLVIVIAALAYGFGGPTWLVYAALFAAAFTFLPGYVRWDERRHSHR
jgi:hypothetical protein